MTTKTTEIITKERYDQLVIDGLMLEALKGAGVDNWSGYSYAMELFRNLKDDEKNLE